MHTELNWTKEHRSLRAPILINDDLRAALECDGVTLEAAFITADEPRATVFVCRVDMPPTSAMVAPTPVVKFSSREHAIPVAERLRLATPRHYRENYENDAEGIHDEREATYPKDMSESIASSLRSDLGTPVDVSPLKAEAIYAADGFWMFCTAVKPNSDGELRQMRDRFARESVTMIASPADFAQELGAAFAAHASWSDVKLSVVDLIARHARPPEMGDKVVWVYHGRVHYRDDSEALVESFPLSHRVAAMSFIKREQYERQHEYRFTVHMNGTAVEETLCVPITSALRGCAVGYALT